MAQTGPLHFLGLTQLLTPEPQEHGALQVRGLYCYVRHPLYFFSLVMLWLVSVMTANLATANVLIALYFWIGSIFEEQKLLTEFGAAYADYQRRVPRLIPRLKRCYPPSTESKA
jgi:protein-S-isoprenylcysteine O-methyltransferase Ste14